MRLDETLMYGQLLPLGGGDPIPLLKTELLVGRRESCDIVLRFANVSAHHCQLECDGGYWYIVDLNSRNGVKVNGKRIQRKRLDSGDQIAVAKHQYRLEYSPADNGAVGPPPPEDDAEDIMSQSLLQRAGLDRTANQKPQSSRYDAVRDQGGNFRDPNEPI